MKDNIEEKKMESYQNQRHPIYTVLDVVQIKEATRKEAFEEAHHKGFQLGWKDGYAEAFEEAVAMVLDWNSERVKEWHKTCTTDSMGNGRFWEAKETQAYLLSLKERA